MACQPLQFLACLRAKYTNASAGSQQRLASCVDRQACDAVLVATKLALQLPVRRVPLAHLFGRAARVQAATVGGKGDVVHGASVLRTGLTNTCEPARRARDACHTERTVPSWCVTSPLVKFHTTTYPCCVPSASWPRSPEDWRRRLPVRDACMRQHGS